jgi:hypothetical protein
LLQSGCRTNAETLYRGDIPISSGYTRSIDPVDPAKLAKMLDAKTCGSSRRIIDGSPLNRPLSRISYSIPTDHRLD